jgi:hypothetical protein
MKVKGRNWIAVGAAVHAFLSEGASVVAVQGPPGSGRTYLAIRLAECMARSGHRTQIVVADEDNQVGVQLLMYGHHQSAKRPVPDLVPEVVTIEEYAALEDADRRETDLVIFDDADTYDARMPARRQAQAVWIGDLTSTPPMTACVGEDLTIQATRMVDSIAELMQRVDYPERLVVGTPPRWRLIRDSGEWSVRRLTELGAAAIYSAPHAEAHAGLATACLGVINELVSSWSLLDSHSGESRRLTSEDVGITCLSARFDAGTPHPPVQSNDGLIIPSRLEDLAEAPPPVVVVCCPADDSHHLRRVMATCAVGAVVVAPSQTNMPLVRHLHHRG